MATVELPATNLPDESMTLALRWSAIAGVVIMFVLGILFSANFGFGRVFGVRDAKLSRAAANLLKKRT